jgi:hypothetical protein
MALYNQTAHAIKSVDKAIKVGGPATAQLLDVKQFHGKTTPPPPPATRFT